MKSKPKFAISGDIVNFFSCSPL